MHAEEDETIAYGDVDLDYLDQVRTSIPISKQKRLELYKSATVLSYNLTIIIDKNIIVMHVISVVYTSQVIALSLYNTYKQSYQARNYYNRFYHSYDSNLL